VPGDGARFRAHFGIGAARPLLLYVGRVAHEKNRIPVACVRRGCAAYAPTALVIAGEGRRAAAAVAGVKLGIGADVQFIAISTERGLADCYAAADVFVFARAPELKAVLLEALAQAVRWSPPAPGHGSILQAGCGARWRREARCICTGDRRILDDPSGSATVGAGAQLATAGHRT